MFKTHFGLWASAAVVLVYFIGYYFFGHDNSKIVMDALVIGASVTVCITWGRKAIGAFFSGVRDGAANILVSIWLVWTLLFGYFLYIQAFTILSRPEWLRISPIGGAFSTLFFLAGAFAVLTPINRATITERVSLRWWLVGIAIGMFTAGALMMAEFNHLLQVA